VSIKYVTWLLGRDPDSRPPTNVPQKIMNAIHRLYQWSKTVEASVRSAGLLLYFSDFADLLSSLLSSIRWSPLCFGFRQSFSNLRVSPPNDWMHCCRSGIVDYRILLCWKGCLVRYSHTFASMILVALTIILGHLSWLRRPWISMHQIRFSSKHWTMRVHLRWSNVIL